ncbi:uncharacterized protein LOC113644168 isoform X3 [Tachysurus fulvidraco]|uniref:uncharacterized protein LOC113644168 isoform X3 n=1 Tax=Tachysurus fulvidraco TaxID=1234273 RepID=UPI001FEFD639|nr:uncharacterized protein LOC113644168 isoform X3 [Tachysurus fulvidraco]
MLLDRCTMNFVFYTSIPVRRCFIYSVWILLCSHSAVSTQSCTEVNQTESIVHHQISQGLSTTINCHYRKNSSQSLTASLRTKHKRCNYIYLNTSWTKQSCIDDIRFTWIPETKEISFQLLNLQINNSGVYTCTVDSILPPPTRCLGQETTFIHVKAVSTQSCTEVKKTESIIHHQISQGLSTTINCHYRKNSSQSLTASLRTKYNLCNYIYSNTSWTKQFCIDDIRFTWSPETKEISFQLLNLQINNSGVYTCAVDSILPPPTRCLGQETTFIHVKAPPSVSVSCVNSSDGVPKVLCTSERFYPADLTQTWLRDGKYINYLNTSLILSNTENLNYSHFNWNYRYNTDGTYSVTSYLQLSSDRAVFYCRVNHSTLTQPITVNISSTECTERRGDDTPAGIEIFGELFVV